MSKRELVIGTIISVLVVLFMVWFVLYGPTPDYLPPYGTGTQPIEMRD